MRNKLLFILFFSSVLCIIIYNIYKEKGIYYLALGELPKDQYRYEYQDYVIDYFKENKMLKRYNKNFLRENYNTETFLDLINNSETSINEGEKETITKAIDRANLITISLGNNELEEIINKNKRMIDYKEIDNIFINYAKILSKIRLLTKTPIIIIGYFNTYDKEDSNIDKTYIYAESKLNDFLEYENTYIIKLYNEFKNSIYTEKLDKIAPSIEGYKYISNKIIEIYNLEIKGC